jgi:hypothetical protein
MGTFSCNSHKCGLPTEFRIPLIFEIHLKLYGLNLTCNCKVIEKFCALFPVSIHFQHFQFCRVGLSLGILYLSILWSHPRYLCRVAAVKSLPVHLINDVIFSILEDRSALHYCCICSIFSLNFSTFSSWVVPIFLLE